MEGFELLKEGKPDYDWVLKTVSSEYRPHVTQIISQERYMAEVLPKYFTPIQYTKVIRSQNKFVGMLLKKRVNGSTLSDVANGRVKDLERDYATISEAFRVFRSGFIEEISQLAEEEIYIGDFHAANIMYDHLEKRWYMIDGLFYSYWRGFMSAIDHSNIPANQATHLPDVWNHISKFPNGPPKDEPARGQFFQKYAYIYFQPYYDSLRSKANAQ